LELKISGLGRRLHFCTVAISNSNSERSTCLRSWISNFGFQDQGVGCKVHVKIRLSVPLGHNDLSLGFGPRVEGRGLRVKGLGLRIEG